MRFCACLCSKVRCAVTGHEMPLDLYWLESHWNGRKYASASKRLAKAEAFFRAAEEATAVVEIAHQSEAVAQSAPHKLKNRTSGAKLLGHTSTSLLGRALARSSRSARLKQKKTLKADDLERWTMDDVAKVDLARSMLANGGGAPLSSAPPSSGAPTSDAMLASGIAPSVASEATSEPTTNASSVRRRNAARAKIPSGMPPPPTSACASRCSSSGHRSMPAKAKPDESEGEGAAPLSPPYGLVAPPQPPLRPAPLEIGTPHLEEQLAWEDRAAQARACMEAGATADEATDAAGEGGVAPPYGLIAPPVPPPSGVRPSPSILTHSAWSRRAEKMFDEDTECPIHLVSFGQSPDKLKQATEEVHTAIDEMVFWQEAMLRTEAPVAAPPVALEPPADEQTATTDVSDVAAEACPQGLAAVDEAPPPLTASAIRAMKVAELREALRLRAFPETGLKAALVARLLEACADADATANDTAAAADVASDELAPSAAPRSTRASRRAR